MSSRTEILNTVFTNPFRAWHEGTSVKRKSAISIVECFGKALDWMLPPLRGKREVRLSSLPIAAAHSDTKTSTKAKKKKLNDNPELHKSVTQNQTFCFLKNDFLCICKIFHFWKGTSDYELLPNLFSSLQLDWATKTGRMLGPAT